MRRRDHARPGQLLTMYGLFAMGLCLMLGLLTPLAAAGRGLPGDDLPEHAPLARPARQPDGRGALLYRQQEPDRDARLPGWSPSSTGHWVGLDALFFGGRRRRRGHARAAARRTKYGRATPMPVTASPDRRDNGHHRDPILSLPYHKERAHDEPDPRTAHPGPREREPGPRHDPPRLAQGRRRRPGRWRLLLRLQEHGHKPRSRPRSSAPATRAARR